MTDIEQVQSHYFANRGIFLVLVDQQVVGTGAVRRLDHEICKLKRMWLLKDYRGQGWGEKMAEMLLDFARRAGYQAVKLDLANQERQPQAYSLYRKLGFYPIERYNDSPC
jgi:putative acetyltransferase